MEFPTVPGVVQLHGDLLARTEGTPGILNLGAVDSAIYRCQWGPFNGLPSLEARAALLLRGICQDHPFADGNKRTAFATTDAFLIRNGSGVRATSQETIDFMLAVAQDQIDLEGIEEWLVRHRPKH